MIRYVLGFLVLAIAAEAFATCENVPMKIDGRKACYRQSSNIKVQTGTIKQSEYIEYEITPVVAEFENVPTPQVLQYIFIEHEDTIKPSKIHIASFLCSGESPLGGDAFSGSLTNISGDIKTPMASKSIFIAAGVAAENVSVSLEKKVRAKVYDRFLQLFEDRTGLATIETDDSNIYVPNVLAGLTIKSLSSVERKLYSTFFNRTNSSLNGCSEKFKESMHHLLIENIAKTNPFSGIEITKINSSSKYKMKLMR